MYKLQFFTFIKFNITHCSDIIDIIVQRVNHKAFVIMGSSGSWRLVGIGIQSSKSVVFGLASAISIGHMAIVVGTIRRRNTDAVRFLQNSMHKKAKSIVG